MLLNIPRFQSQLILEEGLRLMPYDDATGQPVPPGGRARGKLTIGVGRNLDANPLTKIERDIIGHDGRSQPITHEQAMMLLNHDIANVCCSLDHNLPWWDKLDEVRARVLADMCFNMGIVKLLGFKNTLSHARTGAYNNAANDMKASLWYTQVGSRGRRLERMMRTGEDWTA